VELFKRHGFTPMFKESAGGHTWANWRDYLNEFAPQLFQSSPAGTSAEVRPR
jgi:enterochelin esterase family protein